jgi:S1-C subfamily serine protease
LLSVGGKAAVLDRTSFEEQTAQAPGSKVKVEIMRDGKKLTVELALGTVPSD